MRIDQEAAPYSPDRDTVLTIGVFDGVHRGHQHLIRQLVNEATGTGRLAGVVTFRDHPASVLRSDFQPSYITSLEERLSLIGSLGVDLVVPITFDLEVSRLSPREFIVWLQRHLRMRGLVVGPDFAVGHKREGDVKSLTTLGPEMGFTLKVVELLADQDQAVRSTTIRNALAEGDVTLVAAWLGRTFSVTGVVVKGVGRGKTLGFPTANLQVSPGLGIPGDGIYATRAHLGEKTFMAATSIGTRPTFDEGYRTVEAFILDFDGDVYEHQVRLEFVQRLRPEEKYETVEALQRQVDEDVAQTREILGSNAPIPR